MSPESEQGEAVQEDRKPIRQSRWVKKSNVARYSKEQLKELDTFGRDCDGWRNGARVRSV